MTVVASCSVLLVCILLFHSFLDNMNASKPSFSSGCCMHYPGTNTYLMEELLECVRQVISCSVKHKRTTTDNEWFPGHFLHIIYGNRMWFEALILYCHISNVKGKLCVNFCTNCDMVVKYCEKPLRTTNLQYTHSCSLIIYQCIYLNMIF